MRPETSAYGARLSPGREAAEEMRIDRFILRRLGLGSGLGLLVLFGLSIPVLGLRGDDTYLSLVMMTLGAVVFGCSIPRVRVREDRGFSVVMPADQPRTMRETPPSSARAMSGEAG